MLAAFVFYIFNLLLVTPDTFVQKGQDAYNPAAEIMVKKFSWGTK